MRIVNLLTANFLLGSIFFVWKPHSFWPDLDRGADTVVDTAHDFLYKKEIRTSGFNRINSSDVTNTLPKEKSVVWWKFNSSEIERLILVNPMVESAKVSNCSDSRWGCFEIQVQERQPKYMAIFGSEVWLLGADGGFIAPLRSNQLPEAQQLKSIAPDISQVVLIKGLVERQLSPDIVEAKINLITQMLQIVEQNTKLKVRELILDDHFDVTLKFAGHDFAVKFEFKGGEMDKILDQTMRLKKILARYGASISEVGEIDLAFEKMAVVKKVGQPEAVSPDKSKQKSK